MSRSRRVLCSKDLDLNLKSMFSPKQRTTIFILELSICPHFKECGGRKQGGSKTSWEISAMAQLEKNGAWSKQWQGMERGTNLSEDSGHLNVGHKAEQRLWKASRRQRLPSLGSRWCHLLWGGAWEVRIKVLEGSVPSLAEEAGWRELKTTWGNDVPEIKERSSFKKRRYIVLKAAVEQNQGWKTLVK